MARTDLQRLKNDKGFLWASDYWSRNVYQQARNEIATDSPYGSKGDVGWQYIALAEGWANYREAKIKKLEQKLSAYSISTDFPDYYAKMFVQLLDIGCSDSNMEACLTATTITEFKRNLVAKYPYLASRINTIIETGYE